MRQFAAQRLPGIRYAPQARNEGCPPCAYGPWFICAAYWLVRMGRSRDTSRFLTCGVVIGRAAAMWASLRAAGAERALPAMRIWPLSHVSRLADRSHDLLPLCIMQMPLEFSDAALRRIRDHHFVTSMRYVTVFDEETCEKAITTFKHELLRLTTKLPQGIGSVRTLQSLMTDKKAGLKTDSKAKAVKEDAELVFSLARMMDLIDDTFEGSSLDVLILAHERACATKSNAAIATAAAPATAPAADAPTAAPRVSGSGHDKSGLQSENDNRYETVTITTRVLLSKVKKDAQKAALAVEQQKASDAAAAEARKLEQIEAAENFEQGQARADRCGRCQSSRLQARRQSGTPSRVDGQAVRGPAREAESVEREAL